jgi:hypothetical protein
VCTRILQQGISDIGQYWYAGKASVQQEHFASALASRRLEMLVTATPSPRRQQSILLGCPPGEQHTFSVLLLNLLLCRKGLKVIYLGADVPIERLGETAAAVQADLVVLAAQQLAAAAALRSAALALQQSGISMAYGGLIFNRVPALRRCIAGHFLGETLEDATRRIEQLVALPSLSPSATGIDATYLALASLFREKRPLVEMALSNELQKPGLGLDNLNEANSFFGSGLSAALELGDPAFLEADLEWLRKLLAQRQIPEMWLITYLAAYGKSIRKEMGAAGLPLAGWFEASLARTEAGNH